MALPALADPPLRASTPPSNTARDPYQGAVLTLLAGSCVGAVTGFVAGFDLGNLVILEGAVALVLATGVLTGVAVSRWARSRPPRDDTTSPPASPEPDPDLSAVAGAPPAAAPVKPDALPVYARAVHAVAGVEEWLTVPKTLRDIRFATVGVTAVALLMVYSSDANPIPLPPLGAVGASLACLLITALAATVVRYCADVDASSFPEAARLAQGARIVGWIAVLAACSIAAQWFGAIALVRAMATLVAAIVIFAGYNLATVRQPDDAMFPLDLDVLSVFGARWNLVGSVLDAGERQLGIDLRSTWALTVVRRSIEPLAIALGVAGWLATGFTVVGVEEEALVERLGVPARGSLAPGLHLHWPWPIDAVVRLPVRRVQTLTVGHEGKEENGGPEDVLWARQHAANEYTLLLGNGRDLITVDAALQFRIADPHSWRYGSQNPAEALRAIAHRAVMRTTVNRTLADALSENVVATTARMRKMVQDDADALGLGVEVLAFTVGGMHPPVAVASDYQAVVSAELGKVTAVVDAEAERNRTVPYAQSALIAGPNAAMAESATAAAKATGEAWSFLALQSQYRASADEYFYRRRLETLERVLPKRLFTILDHRFQRDGGELWVTP